MAIRSQFPHTAENMVCRGMSTALQSRSPSPRNNTNSGRSRSSISCRPFLFP